MKQEDINIELSKWKRFKTEAESRKTAALQEIECLNMKINAYDKDIEFSDQCIQDLRCTSVALSTNPLNPS